MKPDLRGTPTMDDEGDTMSLSLDDGENLMLSGPDLGHTQQDKLIDTDFFNKFKDDFDESDIKPDKPRNT